MPIQLSTNTLKTRGSTSNPWEASAVIVQSDLDSVLEITGDGVLDPSFTATDLTGAVNELNSALTNLGAGGVEYDSTESYSSGTVGAELISQKNTLNHKADVIYDTASGDIASFPDGADGLTVKDLTVGVEPVQSGTGDPSPTNVRPISGWTGANVTRTGFNQWDEEWELGDINSGTGKKTADNNRFRSKNYIPVLPSTTYYCQTGNYDVIKRMAFYDADKTYLGTSTGWIVMPNGTITTPANAYYALFFVATSIYNNDISINYPATDTAYHAYTGTTIPISWQSSAGTVYGGTLDVTSGVLTVTMGYVDLGTLDWVYRSDLGQGVFSNPFNTISNYLHKSSVSFTCSAYKAEGTVLAGTVMSSKPDKSIVLYYNSGNDSSAMYVKDTAYSDDAIFKTAMRGVQLVYELSTPQTYQLTPTEVTTLLGQNNIWADCGPVSVEYPADTKLYIQKINTPTDDDMIADANIASGKYFIVGNNLYISTAAILAGDPIKPGTNCTLTNLAAALNAINS